MLIVHKAGLGTLMLCVPLLLATGIIAFRGTGVDTNGVHCYKPMAWLMCSGLCCVVSLIFVVYLITSLMSLLVGKGLHRVKADRQTHAVPTHSGAVPQSVEENVVQLLIYDQHIYMYSLLYVFAFVWNCIPAHGPPVTGGEKFPIAACGDMNDVTDVCRALLWIYNLTWLVLLGGMVFIVRHRGVTMTTSSAGSRSRQAQPQDNKYEREMESIMPILE
eukprot:TRINITY_DN51549_c0_g1_i1.p2 TRINITY_DN51549_c0_g1~~TRINITY_DN51549_c0_g1_i1.p2  ORF type:complete len:218 (+),score=58.07 TRINITY_DN51549_c0_g1_i1:104-757(+)